MINVVSLQTKITNFTTHRQNGFSNNATINGISHQLFVAGIQARKILTIKLGLSIDTCSSTDNAPHGSGRVVQKSNSLLQIVKATETSYDHFTCHLFILEHAVAHLEITDLSGSNINLTPRTKVKQDKLASLHKNVDVTSDIDLIILD